MRHRPAQPADRHDPSRRALCGGLGAALLCCCLPELRAQAALLRDQPLAVAEIAAGLFVSQGVHAEANPANLGAIANIGFIIGRERVAVIDSGGCLLWGERLRQAIRRHTDLPIGYLIQSHMHPDHVFGAAAFLPETPEIVGHRSLPAALARREAYYARRLHEALGDPGAGSVIVPPTRLVEATAEIDLGRRVLELVAHRPAHTDNDLSIFDRETRTLWAGDLLFMERVPALDGSLLGWLAAMEELRQVPAARVVPGHGPRVAAWPEGLADQQRYLGLLRDEIRARLRGGGTMEEAIATVGRSESGRWALFDDYHRRNVAAAFHELEWE
ncbi:MAG: quinoprotein relay system zinc metallohydrolase 2 [Stellaceae bacterium]